MSISRMLTSDRTDFVKGIKNTIQNTSISSAVMTAASLYFNKKVKDIWYFSAPTNSTSTVEIVGEGKSDSADNKATSGKDSDVADKTKNALDNTIKSKSAAKNLANSVKTAVAALGKAQSDVENLIAKAANTVADAAKEIGIGSSKNTKTIPKPQNSVLPEAYFIDMAISYGGQAVSAPIEEGSFTTYNKTNEPFKINATLAFDENKGKGILNKKSVTSIQDTLTKLVELKKSPITFDIITPTREYKNVTLEKFDYKFDARVGYGVVFVNAVFVEIPEIKVPQLRPENVKKAENGGTAVEDKGHQTGTIIDVTKVADARTVYGEFNEVTGVQVVEGKVVNIDELDTGFGDKLSESLKNGWDYVKESWFATKK